METFLIKAAQLILAFAFLVIIHEFGHFLFARMFGVRVEKFYMFFNPWFSLCKFKPKRLKKLEADEKARQEAAEKGTVIAEEAPLKEDKEKDENIYEATVIEYQKEMEQVHLILRSGSLSDISLDAVYECRIRTITCETVCTGMIKERYENRAGMILVLQVTNGFYEINLK